jgi:CRISPR-associated endonuclease/helicase Cas3
MQLALDADPIDVELYPTYFRALFHGQDLDKKGICESLKVKGLGEVRFKDAANDFKLIDDKDGATVIIRYRSDEAKEDIGALIGKLEAEGP